jgi:hypothetical protein
MAWQLVGTWLNLLDGDGRCGCLLLLLQLFGCRSRFLNDYDPLHADAKYVS